MTMIKKTRQEIIEFGRNLINFFSDVRNTKFSHFLQRNIKVTQNVEAELVKISVVSKEFMTFENERIALCERFSQKDENLKPVIKDGQYVFGDRKAAFDKEFAKLKFANQTVISIQQAKQKEVQELLKEEIEVGFLSIEADALPGNLSIQQLEILDPLIIGG